MTDKPADQLRKVKALIDTPDKWTKGSFAKLSDGQVCSYDNEAAACFCLDLQR